MKVYGKDKSGLVSDVGGCEDAIASRCTHSILSTYLLLWTLALNHVPLYQLSAAAAGPSRPPLGADLGEKQNKIKNNINTTINVYFNP